MIKKDFHSIFQNLETIHPTVHCITNFVTVNDCANIVLACGGRPTMAHHAGEAEEITAGSQALVLNMGTLHDVDSMILAGKKSNECGHPVVLDPVGVGGSTLRQSTYSQLSEAIDFSVIRGNISEIKKIATGQGGAIGVDAREADQICQENVQEIARMARQCSRDTGSVIAISGPIDIVSDQTQTYLVHNGHPIMARITGSGCMSPALIGAFCGANPDHIREATLAAVAAMGVCGERAMKKTELSGGGTMTFRMHLIDEISLMTAQTVEDGAKIEVCF